MPLSLAQKKALELLRPHRSEWSWIGGSIVLHEILNRTVGDIDIHHPNAGQMHTAITRDTGLLVNNGFTLVSSEHQPRETERLFLMGEENVAINWVWGVPDNLFPLCHNRRMGTHIDFRDAIYQKLLMVFDDASAKHFRDLADCANNRFLDRSLVQKAAQKQQTKPPAEFIDFIETSLLKTGRVANSTIYGGEAGPVRIRRPACQFQRLAQTDESISR